MATRLTLPGYLSTRVVRLSALAVLIATVSAPFLTGCEGDQDQDEQTIVPASTSCTGQAQAEILVQDGYLEDMCGCAEGSQVMFVQPAPLTCTVPVGTTIFFVYEGSNRSHQIISSGTPTFVSSPLWDPPNGNSSNPHYAFLFDATGTYTFFDAMDIAMAGSIVVQ